MSLQFRSATLDDLPAIVSLLLAQELPTDGFADLLRAHPEHVLVAELNGAIVGSAALDVHGADALLRSVVVASDLITLGVGTRLVTDLLTFAANRRISDVFLLTTTAAEWFPRFGFRVTERSLVPRTLSATVEFTKACPSSAVVMHAVLPNPNP
jgi:amino-acid N-acetyltransferase